MMYSYNDHGSFRKAVREDLFIWLLTAGAYRVWAEKEGNVLNGE